jgi:hypothetical protein
MTDRGQVVIYVDDLIGVCHRQYLQFCMDCGRTAIVNLLGPPEKTIAENKSESGRRLDIIGWSIDLDLRRVGLARHLFLKTLHGFFSHAPGDRLTVRELQKLGSWASRYTQVCRFMRPFSSFLYRAFAGYTNLEVRPQLSTDFWAVIALWEMFLSMMAVDPIKYTRSIASFSPSAASLFVNLDASLTGIGAIITPYTLIRATTASDACDVIPTDLLVVFGYNTCYSTSKESRYQNAMEFTCSVVVIAILASLGYRDTSIMLEGDSRTSLAWSAMERFTGEHSVTAAMALILISSASGLVISETKYLPGTLMDHRSDKLSRGVIPESLGYPPSAIKQIERNQALVRLIELIDPTRSISLEDDLAPVWFELETVIGVLMTTNGGW